MGNRSYLFTESERGWEPRFEANHVLPILWIALLEQAALSGEGSSGGPTLRLDEGPIAGVSMRTSEALGRLAARRDAIRHWLGDAAARVVDQFADALTASGAARIHVDFSEWLEAANTATAGIDEVRSLLTLLDRPRPTRRSAAVTRVLREYGLLGRPPETPAFAVALAGAAASGPPPPWLRERRPRRQPGEARFWVADPSRYFLAGDGSVVIGTVTTRDHLHSILRLHRKEGRWRELPVDPGMEHVHPYTVSHDGGALFGTWQASSFEASEAFRWLGGEHVEVLPHKTNRQIVPFACSWDGRVAVGWSYAGDSEARDYRASLWREGEVWTDIDLGATPAQATHVSADGRRLAGTYGGEFAHHRAYVWSEEQGFIDLGIESSDVKWIEFAPDGKSGILRAGSSQRLDDDEYWRWREGAALERGPNVFNPPPGDATVRVVGHAGRIERIDERGLSEVYVQHRARDGSWQFAARFGTTYEVLQWLIWRRDGGWLAWDVDLGEDALRLLAVAGGDDPDSLVVLAASRLRSTPCLWTPRHGFDWFSDPPQ